MWVCLTEGEVEVVDRICAEMVANVWKVLAVEGAHVQEDEAIAILESMKMEIPVMAESAGILTRLAVKEGDTVQEGDLIAVVE